MSHAISPEVQNLLEILFKAQVYDLKLLSKKLFHFKPAVTSQTHYCNQQITKQQSEQADDKDLSAKTLRIYALINDYEEFAKNAKFEHNPKDLMKKMQKKYSGLNHELRSIWSDMNAYSNNQEFEEEIKTVEALLTDFPKRALEDFQQQNASEVQKKAALKILDRMIKAKKEFKTAEVQTDDIVDTGTGGDQSCTIQLSKLQQTTEKINRDYEKLNQNYAEHLKNEAKLALDLKKIEKKEDDLKVKLRIETEDHLK